MLQRASAKSIVWGWPGSGAIGDMGDVPSCLGDAGDEDKLPLVGYTGLPTATGESGMPGATASVMVGHVKPEKQHTDRAWRPSLECRQKERTGLTASTDTFTNTRGKGIPPTQMGHSNSMGRVYAECAQAQDCKQSCCRR